MPRALLSVSDKTGLVEFARGLAERGYDVISTGGTARAIRAAGVPVTRIDEVTGFPEMLDGRVKTLHPGIHAGILARRDHAEDLAAVAEHEIRLIDIVAVNLYPFARAAANASTPMADLIEEIDIGGPTLLRAAAKNFSGVLAVVSPDDYPAVLGELDRPGGPSPAFRFALARKVFAHTAAYDSMISVTLDGVTVSGAVFTRTDAAAAATLGSRLALDLIKVRDLRYGENPHQRAAWYRSDRDTDQPRIVQGKELSFTNLLDLDSAQRIVAEFSEPAAVLIKHTNPCGAATGESIALAYLRARDADALAAYGGIAGLNRPIDAETARAITSTFIEAVIAPGAAPDALPILAAKKNMRVLLVDPRAVQHPRGHLDLRSIAGGVLVQERDRVREAGKEWSSATAPDNGEQGLRVVTRREPTPEEWAALRFAWRITAHVKSNAVVFTTAGCTLAVGAGQMSRVDAVKTAIMKAASLEGRDKAAPLAGSVAGSDAFFPFRDGLDAIADAGATAVVQPGGLVRDAEVIAAADERHLAMVFTGRRHFRH